MEDNSQIPPGFTLSSDEGPFTPQNTPISDTASTATSSPGHQSMRNEPQFLHGSGWPSVNALNQVVGTAIQSLDNDTSVTGLVLLETSNREAVRRPIAHGAHTDTWDTVTPDQISMALDLWDPDDCGWPHPITATANASDLTSTAPVQASTTASQQSLFLRELMDEYLTRIQTVEHIKELHDHDNAVEIVSTLEQYRQHGWAEELIRAFPRECTLFWSRSGLDIATRGDGEIVFEGFDPVVSEDLPGV